MSDYPGVRKRFTFTCSDTAGTPADPTTLTVKQRRLYDTPDVLTWPTDSEIVHDDTGIFHVDLDFPHGGDYAVRAEAAGALVAAVEVTLTIEAGSF